MGMEKPFPQAALVPFEGTPRIKAETAKSIFDTMEHLLEADPEFYKQYHTAPAICVAVWSGSLVKWIVNEAEASETLRNLEKHAADIARKKKARKKKLAPSK